MEQVIKTMDLCERCEYLYGNNCMEKRCIGCELNGTKHGYRICQCWEIEFNTPCPYFKERAGDV